MLRPPKSESNRLTNGAFFEGIATKGALTQRRLTKKFFMVFFPYSPSTLLCFAALRVLILVNHSSFLLSRIVICLFVSVRNVDQSVYKSSKYVSFPQSIEM